MVLTCESERGARSGVKAAPYMQIDSVSTAIHTPVTSEERLRFFNYDWSLGKSLGNRT